ncbi:MAG: hypothetical protein HQ564_07380 [Candidatus Saganbacteria bacterium]|nr:hypothetical protein [Candidatus Saganbacteria bacterium]
MIRIKLVFIVLVILAIFIDGGLCMNNDITKEEYRVYSDFLLHKINSRQSVQSPPQKFVVSDKAYAPDSIKYSDAKGWVEYQAKVELDKSTIDDFNQKNKEGAKFENKFSINPEVVVTSNEATTQFSRAGFNDSKTQAVFRYYSYGYPIDHPVIVVGYLIVMVKEGDRWVVKGEIMSAIS